MSPFGFFGTKRFFESRVFLGKNSPKGCFFLVFPVQEKLFPSLNDISNTLPLSNLEEGADLGRSRLVHFLKLYFLLQKVLRRNIHAHK